MRWMLVAAQAELRGDRSRLAFVKEPNPRVSERRGYGGDNLAFWNRVVRVSDSIAREHFDLRVRDFRSRSA